jgi:hypothetical protein
MPKLLIGARFKLEITSNHVKPLTGQAGNLPGFQLENAKMQIGPDLIADGHRRIWSKVFILHGARYAKIDEKLRPVDYDEKRGVYVTLPISISPKITRYFA